MEVRYTTPYVSGLRWRLHEIIEGTPVQDQSGNQAIRVDQKKPGLTIEVTPYLGTVKGKTKPYEFGDGSNGLPTMADVLAGAGDVAGTWAAALDQMADIFPLLKEPPAAAKKDGLPVYLRLDSWQANLQWDGAKAVTAILGIYSDKNYADVQAYVSLVFADGATLRQREQQRDAFTAQIEQADSILSDPPTYPNWSALNHEQQQQLTKQAPLAKKSAQENLTRMSTQLVAPLSDLLSIVEVQQSVGALIAACFSGLVAADADWKDVDVATVMSKFALPDVE